jgi:beta-1,4-mannosyltransferase
MQSITVFTLPASLTSNPYVSLLYGSIEGRELNGAHFRVKPFSFRALFADLFAPFGSHSRSIVHIHWETNIYGSRFAILSVFRMAWKFPLLFLSKGLGARVVWTMHNTHAHDYPFPALDAFGRECMWRLADAVIIQNKEMAAEYARARPRARTRRRARVVYIPHGNYIGAYGPEVSKVSEGKGLRAERGIPEDAIVLLALGAVRPYKELERLIDSVCVAAQKEPRLRLVIAGKSASPYKESLSARVAGMGAVQFFPEFIPDADIPAFFAAADYAVFAHGESSLTSGALLLALSYGTPVITLPMPAAEIIVDGVNGYVAKDEAALVSLLESLASLPIPNADSVKGTVEGLSWERVGTETCALYDALWKRNFPLPKKEFMIDS